MLTAQRQLDEFQIKKIMGILITEDNISVGYSMRVGKYNYLYITERMVEIQYIHECGHSLRIRYSNNRIMVFAMTKYYNHDNGFNNDYLRDYADSLLNASDASMNNESLREKFNHSMEVASTILKIIKDHEDTLPSLVRNYTPLRAKSKSANKK